MAHFAEIDENNIVTRVLVVDDANENDGQTFLAETCNLGGTWIKTSYNSKIRKNFASIGYKYDDKLDAFIEPKPFNSWLLNEVTCKWEPPIDYPQDGFIYIWDEPTLSWNLINFNE